MSKINYIHLLDGKNILIRKYSWGKSLGKWTVMYTVGWSVYIGMTFGDQLGQSYSMQTSCIIPQSHFFHYVKALANVSKNMCIRMFITAFFVIVKLFTKISLLSSMCMKSRTIQKLSVNMQHATLFEVVSSGKRDWWRKGKDKQVHFLLYGSIYILHTEAQIPRIKIFKHQNERLGI